MEIQESDKEIPLILVYNFDFVKNSKLFFSQKCEQSFFGLTFFFEKAFVVTVEIIESLGLSVLDLHLVGLVDGTHY